jgi:hypothetical protein
MSVENIDKIDLVATRPNSLEVRLVITDHLPWSDEDGHLRLLQAKLNTYIAFVESGQVFKMPEHEVPPGSELIIVVAARYSLTTAGEAFMRQAQQVLSRVGIGFRFELRGA